MQKWEYAELIDDGKNHSGALLVYRNGRELETMESHGDVCNRIEKLGMDGWELVSVIQYDSCTNKLYFKSPI